MFMRQESQDSDTVSEISDHDEIDRQIMCGTPSDVEHEEVHVNDQEVNDQEVNDQEVNDQEVNDRVDEEIDHLVTYIN